MALIPESGGSKTPAKPKAASTAISGIGQAASKPVGGTTPRQTTSSIINTGIGAAASKPVGGSIPKPVPQASSLAATGVGAAAAQPFQPGGFNDPSIDWAAVYNAFFGSPSATDSGMASSGGGGGLGGGGGMAQAAPPAPVYEAPSAAFAPHVEAPASVSSAASSVTDAPTGANFETVGQAPGTFGGFERLRNQRTPKTGLSMTPEMLRRAAQSRLG